MWYSTALSPGRNEYSFDSSGEWSFAESLFPVQESDFRTGLGHELDETSASSDSTSEDEGSFRDKQRVSHVKPDRPTSSAQASSSSFVKSAFDGFQSGSGQHGPLALGEV